MKGIVLAGGNGTRLLPITKVISKQLLPVYDKPMIYYPLQTLKSMGIKEVAIITKSVDEHAFRGLLGDGSEYSMKIEYFTQDEPKGIAEAFIICEEYIRGEFVTLILGDNIFITERIPIPINNTIYTYHVKHPEQYGVAIIGDYENLITVVEKPTTYMSSNAVVGLYTFDHTVSDKAKKLTPSKRGELEITDIINMYIEDDNIHACELSASSAWFDCGTVDDLNSCSNFIRSMRERTTIQLGL